MLTHENLKEMYETYMKIRKPVKEQEYTVPTITPANRNGKDFKSTNTNI